MNQNDQEKDILKMTFDPATIEHLGVRMYSTLPPVLAELVANSYDANASDVTVFLYDKYGKREIAVKDNGIGMNLEEINSKFLRIGRNRRDEEEVESITGGRKVIGKKGIGKLSFFGIAEEIEVITKKNLKMNVFILRWQDIKESKTAEYHPQLIKIDEPCDAKNGTTIILRGLHRQTEFDSSALAVALSKIFIVDNTFKVSIQYNEENPFFVENEKKYADLKKEVEWDVPKEIKLESDYSEKNKVTGYLIATETPISPKTNMRGVTLFSRKKLVNLPEYFSESMSSHFFSYLTGWLEVDFIDDLDEDVIATDRKSLNWGHPEMLKLRDYLRKVINWLEQDWRKRRAEIRSKEAENKTGMSIGEWRNHIPENIREDLDPIIGALLKDSEMTEEKLVSSLKGLQNIIKPYPYFHWRNLHPVLKKIVFNYYKNSDYYGAVLEGVTEYVNQIKAKTASSNVDLRLIKEAFSPDQPKPQNPPLPPVLPILSVTKKYKRPDGTDFKPLTLENISKGHGLLARAMWMAFRNPKAHETAEDLRQSGLYTEQDCLDALSLLSHLFNRLDNAETI
ncbi:MAG: ATP-binding protein [Candidatus Paceibacterota bacterium]|jgi:hypothetical protein